MYSRSSCLPLAPEGRRLGCRALPSRYLPFASRSTRPTAADILRKTAGGAEARRPRTACEAFWTGWQKSPKGHGGPQLFSGLPGQKEAAMPEQQQDSPDDAEAQLGDLARMTFAHFALFFCSAFFIDPAFIIPYWLAWGYYIRTRVWSPTSVARTAVALTAPLPLVRLLMTVRALDLNALVGDAPQHTALMKACAFGNNERIRGLLSLGASPDVAPVGKPRPLLIASNLGHTEAAEELLRAGANPNFLPGESTSPLKTACIGGHAGVVRALANAGAPVNAPVAPTTAKTRNYTPLLVAITFGHVAVVEALLQAGASPTAYDNSPTPICVACAADDIPGPARAAIVHLLLQAGADPRVVLRPQPGESSRTGSVVSGYTSGDGGSRGGREAGRLSVSAIDLAARYGAAEVIPVLVAAGEDPGRAPADVSYEELQAGVVVPPPLFTAAVAGHVDAVQALVAAGADVEATVGGLQGLEGSYCGTGSKGGSGGGGRWGERGGGGGLTPLFVAAQLGHVDVVRALVAAGADTRVLYDDGTTLLQAAREGGMVEMEEVLLAAEAAWN